MRRAVLIELAQMAGGLVLTGAVFRAAAWSYPQGADAIWTVGCGALAAVLAMSGYELRRAMASTPDRLEDWRKD